MTRYNDQTAPPTPPAPAPPREPRPTSSEDDAVWTVIDMTVEEHMMEAARLITARTTDIAHRGRMKSSAAIHLQFAQLKFDMTRDGYTLPIHGKD